MPRIFAYARVSTIHQETDNQIKEIESAGKMTMGVINTVAQFERDVLIERTQSGLARAKSNGKALGRPKILSESQRQEVIEQLKEGKAIALVARSFSTSRQTIMRIRDGH